MDNKNRVIKSIEIPVSKRKIKRNIFYRIVNRLIKKIGLIIISTNIYKVNLKKRYPINTPGEIIWCNPQLINSMILNNNDFHPLRKFSSLEDGDWDKHYYDMRKLNIYKAFYGLIKENKSFKETNFYNPNIKNRIEFENNSTWAYISEYEYDKRLDKIQNLINNIKKYGYKSQTQLGKDPRDEIIVKIGRYGEIFFFDGIHRFCIAKILGIEKIPIIVKSRHPEWVKFKLQLYDYVLSNQQDGHLEKYISQNKSHPDLQDIPFLHSRTSETISA